jgi:tRNA U34 5-methylaminomethyl-2-thiouridine-forming methyltransferase MnmC
VNTNRQIITTSDGSKTIWLKDCNEYYHSKHGAVQEAQHVFLKNGLRYFSKNFKKKEIDILEMGFGTGLNAFLTAVEFQNYTINYTAIEAYPLSAKELTGLCYPRHVEDNKDLFEKIHCVAWENFNLISPRFRLRKQQLSFENTSYVDAFDLIYFDAFGARVQPELWTTSIFNKMYTALRSKGVLVTYSAKGSVRRSMQEVGFFVERLKGPPGKREMLRAIKEG